VRLPEILSKTFELARKSIDKEKIEDMKDDLLKLIELTTFELTITNKKELKIQLFDVLDGLISNDKSILDIPPLGINTKFKYGFIGLNREFRIKYNITLLEIIL
ncbi:MAG: hypothetical protein PHO80_04560, partial [Candidatus Gracilibacteria bacterium]|nr:hypothetical protein [Candidatus Gracilibacteria bacterium]